MVNEAVVTELRNAYSESIRRTSHFMISTFTILFILVVIVQLELLRAKSQTQALRRDVIGVTQRLDHCTISLSNMSFRFREALQQVLSSNTLLSTFSEDRPAQLLSRDVIVSAQPKQIETEQNNVKEQKQPLEELKLDKFELDKEIRTPSRTTMTATQQKEIEAIQNQVMDRLRKVEDWLRKEHEKRHSLKKDSKEFSVHEQDFSTTRGLARDLAKNLNLAAENLKPYKKTYENCLSLKKSAQTKQNQLHTMSAERKSIPTPFGEFLVPPKLALMALAFASVLTYLTFLVSIVKIRRIVEDYLFFCEEKEPVPLNHAPPFWLYGVGSRNSVAVYRNKAHSKLLLIANAGIHIGWILFAAWLIYQSLALKAASVLFSDYRKFADYILLIIFIVTVVFAWVLFYPKFLNESRSKPSELFQEFRRISKRRAFLGISVAGFITGAAYYFGIRFAGSKSKYCISELNLSLSPDYEGFVGNRRTKVLHHLTSCRNHLPRPVNRIKCDASSILFCPHAGYGSRMLEQLAIMEIKRKQGESAVPYLRKAIELDPLGYRLYDQLIGLYGRLRQYNEIERLLKDALQHVQKKTQQNFGMRDRDSLCAQKTIRRAENEFNLRLKTYYDRAHRKTQNNS